MISICILPEKVMFNIETFDSYLWSSGKRSEENDKRFAKVITEIGKVSQYEVFTASGDLFRHVNKHSHGFSNIHIVMFYQL